MIPMQIRVNLMPFKSGTKNLQNFISPKHHFSQCWTIGYRIYQIFNANLVSDSKYQIQLQLLTMLPDGEISLTSQYLYHNTEINFSMICKNVMRHKQPISNSVVGIITDCTRPLYRPKEKNYIVQLKVIDQSLNDSNVFGVMCKDCTVYLLSDKRKDLRNIVRSIGDIVILDKFTFTLWNGIKLETKYLKITEGLYIINETQPDKLVIQAGLSMNPELFQFGEHHQRRIKHLLQWRAKQMYKHFDPKIGINVMNNHCAMIEPFNMFLKIGEKMIETKERTSQEVKTYRFSRIMLTDMNDNRYGLSNQDREIEEEQFVDLIEEEQGEIREVQPPKNPVQQIYKQLSKGYKTEPSKGFVIFVRGIKSINQSLQIQLTETGNILRVNYNLPNPEVFMNYMAIHREGEKMLIENKTPINLIEDGKQDSTKPFTLITEQHNKNTTYIKDLIDLQDKYNHSSKKQEIPINDSYLIKVIAIKFKGVLSLYHRQYQIMIDDNFYNGLPAEEKKQCIQLKKIGYIYEGSIFVLDRSTESRGKLFEVKIFNCDAIGSFLLDHKSQKQFAKAQEVIGDEKKGMKERKKLQQIIDEKLNRICTKSDFQRMAYLSVEPICSEKLLFRLINTKIV